MKNFRTFEIYDFDAMKFYEFQGPQKLKLAKLKFCVPKKSKPTKIKDFCGVKIKNFDRFFEEFLRY